MWSVTSRWVQALTQSHRVTRRVEVWRSGTYLGEVPVGGGSVTVRAGNRVRRTLTVTVPDAYWPGSDPSALLTPYGSELRVWRGIDYGTTSEEVPVFRGRIDSVVDRDRYDGQVEVSCSDQMAIVNDARFEYPRALDGFGVVDGITTLIQEAIPDAAVVDLTGSGVQIPYGTVWDRDRGQAIDDLARSIGAEVYADPVGVFVIRAVPALTGAAVWSLTDGAGGTLVSDSRSVSRNGAFSVVVATVEGADGRVPLRAVVADTNPASPTYVGGPFGRVPRFYASSLVVDVDQAAVAARAILNRSLGLARTREVTCVPNAALEAGDVISISVAGTAETHIADELTLPLDVDQPAMRITTRSAIDTTTS